MAAEHLAAKHPAELSPGELRRVALARGLARIEAGATVLLLDEPTAHLDRESATVVGRALAGLRGKVTVLLVAHDRQTRELADTLVAAGAARRRGTQASNMRTPSRRCPASAGGDADARGSSRVRPPVRPPEPAYACGRLRRRLSRSAAAQCRAAHGRRPAGPGGPGAARPRLSRRPAAPPAGPGERHGLPPPASWAPWRPCSPSPSPGSPAG